jgi:hypothetical protein
MKVKGRRHKKLVDPPLRQEAQGSHGHESPKRDTKGDKGRPINRTTAGVTQPKPQPRPP